MVAILYAFVCQIRAQRIARKAVRRLREISPRPWQSIHWFYRRLTSPVITMKVFRARHGLSDPSVQEQFERVTRLERRQLVAICAAALCIAITLVGTRFWGWAWDVTRWSRHLGRASSERSQKRRDTS